MTIISYIHITPVTVNSRKWSKEGYSFYSNGCKIILDESFSLNIIYFTLLKIFNSVISKVVFDIKNQY
jgi:hypothetical protein